MISVRNLTRWKRLPPSFFVFQARRILRLLRLGKEVDLELVLLSERKMKLINRRWRKKQKPATVLSFPASPEFPLLRNRRYLGEVFLSPAYIEKTKKNSLRFELTRFLLHGILHLSGYHHHFQRDRVRMERLECKLLEKLFHGSKADFCN